MEKSIKFIIQKNSIAKKANVNECDCLKRWIMHKKFPKRSSFKGRINAEKTRKWIRIREKKKKRKRMNEMESKTGKE